jgi:hypothetical protein
VAPPAPVTAPRAPFVLLVLCLVVAGVFGIMWLNTKINENAFRVQRLQQQQGTLDRQEDRLKQDLAQQEDPGNLAALARGQGSVPMTNQAFINLPDGQQIGVPKPAAGGAAKPAPGATTKPAPDGVAQAAPSGR